MALKITKQDYEKLIEQDLSILRKHLPDSPENDHIRLVLTNSIDMHYPSVGSPEPSTESGLHLANVKASVEFAFKVSRAMKEIGSSQIYFLMQQAYGDIDWDEVTQIWDKVQTEVKHLP